MTLDAELRFLKTLARNNNRDWFERNKPKYLDAKSHFEEFIGLLLTEMSKFDTSVTGLQPRKVIFRIYRDVRFSKDKRPYKTNMGASISAAGKGIGRTGYYIHIEPGGKSMAAGGMYMPESGDLAKVRQEIDYNGAKLEKIMKGKSFRKTFGDFWDEDKLKKMPKGYPKDHRYIEWLKLKSFIVIHEFPDKEVLSPGFVRKVANAFQLLKPLNDFMDEALS